MPRIVALDVKDVRFPTSESRAGSDAVNTKPNYSVAYASLHADDGSSGYGFAFTTGRGTEVQAAAISALAPHVVGVDLAALADSPGMLYRRLKSDAQLRWLGPEKGVIQMAIGAVVNAGWDLLARMSGKPMWRFLLDLELEQIVDAVDFTYLTDSIEQDRAAQLLARILPQRDHRLETMRIQGHPAYTTSAGWLGYSDEQIAQLAREAVGAGFDLLKLKVGSDTDADLRRIDIVRSEVPDHVLIAVDANQCWDVTEAIQRIKLLSEHRLAWVEEPTSPDDILGHALIRRSVAPVKVATGEHAANRVVFKQLLQADAIDILQLDATRVGGMNEHLAILILAASFGVPVVPHAGGVGLCELSQHLAIFDALALSAHFEVRLLEYVDHLHEHFEDPVRIVDGAYQLPVRPGYSSQMKQESVETFRFPDGAYWLAQ